MRTLDPKTLSEIALALCFAGAIVVWLGLRADRHVMRWGGMGLIVVGLVGLIFQGSLTNQTSANPGIGDVQLPTAASISRSPTPAPKPSASPSHKKPPPKKKKTHPTQPAGGGYTAPVPPAPQPNPPANNPPTGGFGGSPVP